MILLVAPHDFDMVDKSLSCNDMDSSSFLYKSSVIFLCGKISLSSSRTVDSVHTCT